MGSKAKAQFQNKKIPCRDCQKEFVWSVGEQKFFASKGLVNVPSRCPACREAFKNKKKAGELDAEIICSKCGAKDRVPFAPRRPETVLCSGCFEKSLDEA